MSGPGAPGLTVQNLRVEFGGLVAVGGIGFDAPLGRLTALIGPNGAGKTTTFNACSGLVRPTAGSVSLFGSQVDRLSASARARLGLGRTFQQMELFNSLSVEENVALGAEARMAGGSVIGHLRPRGGEREEVAARTDDALARCGIEGLAGERVGRLSTGQRRLVELARVLAGRFRMLLLDEPSSGLDAGETRRFGHVLREVVDEDGVGILLVEHDMALVDQVSDHVYVLDFGEMIFEGTIGEVKASEVVRAAYMGTEAA